MKRFYTLVSSKKEESGFSVLLDNRPVKTKAGHVLLAPSERAADALVAEWAGQEDDIDPDTMPLTTLLNTKIDYVADNREALSAQVLKYLNTDLLCYPAPGPDALCALQGQFWQPWRNWFEGEFGAPLKTTTGLSRLTQEHEIHNAVRTRIDEMNDDIFTVLQTVTALTGSLILALAFVKGAAKSDDVLKAVFVEEDYKADLYNEAQYGGDPLTEKKCTAVKRDLEAAAVFLKYI